MVFEQSAGSHTGFVANKLAKLDRIFKAIHSLAAQLQSFVYIASYMNTSILMVRNYVATPLSECQPSTPQLTLEMQRYTFWVHQYITSSVSRYSDILHDMA